MSFVRYDVIIRILALSFKIMVTAFLPAIIGIELYGKINFLTATSYQLSLIVGSGFAVVLTRELAQKRLSNLLFLKASLSIDTTIFLLGALLILLTVLNGSDLNHLILLLSVTEILNTTLIRCNVSSGNTRLANLHTSIRFVTWPFILAMLLVTTETLILSHFAVFFAFVNIITAAIILKNTDLDNTSFLPSTVLKLIKNKKKTVIQYYLLYLIEFGFSIFLKFYLLNLLSANDFGQLMYAIAIISIFDSVLDLFNSEYYQKIMEKSPIPIFSFLIIFCVGSTAIGAVIAWGVVVSANGNIDSGLRNTIILLMLVTMIGKYIAFQPYLSLQARHQDMTIFYVELTGIVCTIFLLKIIGTSTLLSAFIIFVLQQNIRNFYFVYAHVQSK